MSAPADKTANPLWQPTSLISPAQPLTVVLISLLCVWECSVSTNNIINDFTFAWSAGDAADQLAAAVLEHAIMTDFCGIPLVSLRENSITELDLGGKSIGVPGAIVLSKLLPSAVALTSLECAAATCAKCLLLCISAHWHAYSLTNSIPPLARSFGGNFIECTGAFALAAVLKETMISHLKCAAAPALCSLSCQRALTQKQTKGAAHLRFVICVSLRTAASAEAPSAPMPLR